MGRITINGTMSQFSCKLTVRSTLWDAKANKASGKSLEAQRLNEKLENIKTNIGKQYQRLCDRDSYVTAEKVKNAYLGFGEKYRLLLEAFEKFTGDLKKRVGIDRCHGTWNRYYKSIDHLRTFMRKEYNVSDMPLAELEQSFIEQYHVYLKSDLAQAYDRQRLSQMPEIRCQNRVQQRLDASQPLFPLSIYGSESGT